MTHSSPPVLRRLFAALFTGALAIALPSVAARADNEADATMKVEAGVRGWYDPGDHIVVTAQISADTLFTGHVDVVASSGAIVSKDVQVAGGTTKTVLLVAPTSADNAPIDIRLYRGGDLIAKKPITMKIAEEFELVGVMPALATRVGKVPDQTNLASGTGRAQLVELSLEQMALGSSALDVFDTVVGTAADVRSLQPDQLSALLGWLNRGGRLLLDDATDLSALPTAWQPGAGGWSLAGRGEIHLVDGKASSGQWASIIEPSGSSTSELAGVFTSPEQIGSVQQDLARRAGVKLPSMLPLLVPLLTYLVVVSVVLFFVLKALRRLTLAWVAIPLLAALTAGIVVWYGQQWRTVGKPAVSVFVDGYPGGGDATASLLAFSRDGGTVKVGMPGAWQSDSEVAFFFGGPGSGAPPTLSPGSDTSQLRVRLDPGQVTSVNVVGPSVDSGLAVDAHVQSGKIVGTVTNKSSVTLHEVAVFSLGNVTLLGTLQPGASNTFSLDSTTLPTGFSLADRVWDSTADPRAAKDEIAEFGIWTNAAYGRVMYPSGMVRAAGWTTEQPLGFKVSGGLTTTTVLTSVAPIDPGAAPLPAAAVRWSLVRTPFGQFGNGTSDAVYRYVLPPAAAPGQRTVLELPSGLSSMEVWNGTAWVAAKATKRIITIPASSIINGVIMARVPNDDGSFFPGDQSPVVRGATPKDPS